MVGGERERRVGGEKEGGGERDKRVWGEAESWEEEEEEEEEGEEEEAGGKAVRMGGGGVIVLATVGLFLVVVVMMGVTWLVLQDLFFSSLSFSFSSSLSPTELVRCLSSSPSPFLSSSPSFRLILIPPLLNDIRGAAVSSEKKMSK